MWKEFRAFLMRGNVLDLAVGIIIGVAFGTIVNTLVNDVIMPPIGLALGKVDFSNLFLLLHDGPKAPRRTRRWPRQRLPAQWLSTTVCSSTHSSAFSSSASRFSW